MERYKVMETESAKLQARGHRLGVVGVGVVGWELEVGWGLEVVWWWCGGGGGDGGGGGVGRGLTHCPGFSNICALQYIRKCTITPPPPPHPDTHTHYHHHLP